MTTKSERTQRVNLKADSEPRMGYALENVGTGQIVTALLVEHREEAVRLLQGQVRHMPHLGQHRIVQVKVVLERVAS